jgi:hypothetical protein
MKAQRFFRILTILLILAGSVSSCSKKESPKEPVCNVNNPLTDLPWLKERVNDYNEDAKAGNKRHAQIYQCTYKDGTGFLVDDIVGSPDAALQLFNCEGVPLCTIGGIATLRCEEYDVDLENKKLIWEINR